MPKPSRRTKPGRKKTDDSRSKSYHGGYPKEDVAKIKAKAWWCGDHTCDAAGNGSWTVGGVYRICDPGSEGCPTNAIPADGSKWTFSANCKQDA